MGEKINYYRYWGKANRGEGGEYKYHLLVYHCLDVAAVGKVWLDQNPSFVKRASIASGLSETAFTEWFLFFLALHDMGKFDVRFQNLRPDLLLKLQGIKSELTYYPRHDQRGFDFWNEFVSPCICSELFDTGSEEYDLFRDWLYVFGILITGHHGLPPKSSTFIYIRDSDRIGLDSFVKVLLEIFISSEACKSITKICKNEDQFDTVVLSFKQFSWQLAGLTSLCDWIASGDDAFEFCSENTDLTTYFEEVCEKAETAVKKAEVIPALLSKEQGLRRLFPQFLDSQTPLQKFCNETPVTGEAQLWILEDVTGSGKTEAALTLASRILGAGGGTGCFVALPTMATSNAMYERMAKVYSSLYEDGCRPSLTLSHGSRHFSETFTNSYRNHLETLPHSGAVLDENLEEGKAHCSQWLADSSKKSLLADVGVGTVDQILMAGLPVRYQSLRAFGISRKILIIDEVHAFDAYMLRLLENIITAQAAFGGSVILLSATLPFSVRKKFCRAFSDGLGINSVSPEKKNIFPLITSVTPCELIETGVATRKSVARKVSVKFKENIEDVYKLIEKNAAEGKCVCWIRNTITDVMASFNELQKRGLDNFDMFHSRFALNDRLAIESRVLKRFGKDSTTEDRKGQILVASQVVEQSLDLDFDVMISDLAPVDLLIQRAGRLHRHERGERGKPVFYVHTPKDTENPSAEWYSEFFPNAQWVYKDTALLWRTKEILKKQKQFKMPEDARLLIESVYGDEEVLEIQDVFNIAEDEAWGKMMADKSLAEFNILNFNFGYCNLSSHRWDEEERVPTRLSDPANTLCLCRWDGKRVVPLYNDAYYSWDISSMSIRKSSLSVIQYNAPIQNAIDILKKQKRFKYNTLFLVFPEDELVLQGSDERGKNILVKYTKDKGLVLIKEDE